MRLAVNGAAGAMGRRLVSLAAEADDCAVVGAIDRPDHPQLGTDVGILAGVGTLGVSLASELDLEADVMLDFSAPEAAVSCALHCADRGIGLVSGTTGLSDEQRATIEREVASRVAVLMASNMALGVNLMFDLAAQVARALPAGYDVEIVEVHHRRKKDAPSGTARELARRIRSALGRDESVLRYGREGLVGRRPAEEIAVHAVRGGDVVGDHTVIFAGDGERIELTHRATTRDVFAFGALQAARFVCGRSPGLYTMTDVLA